jgi:succinyl-CoA synthetase alpha subunit
MIVLLNKNSKIIVQGFTVREGTFHAGQIIKYGTNVMGGVTPRKGGQNIKSWWLLNKFLSC